MSQRDNHESYEVFASRLHWIAGIIAATLVAIVWLMYVLSRTWLGPPPQAPRAGAAPTPRLQPNPHIDLDAHRARERALLQSYAWIDREAGIARIPIERAMELLATSPQEAKSPPPGAAASWAGTRPGARSPPPADLYRRAGVDQRLGAQVPLRLTFRDSHGRDVTLAELTRGKPTLLALGYYHCPNLCDMVLHGMARAAGIMPLRPGSDYEVTFVSIDPHETPRDARATADALAHDDPAADPGRWHLLTGDQASIQALSQAIGFRYFRDARIDQYAHAAGVVVLTGEGLVARYFFGVSYPPQTLRLTLIDASKGRLGTLIDRLVLLCCAYDPDTGRYSLLIGKVMQAIGVGFVLFAAAGWAILQRRARS